MVVGIVMGRIKRIKSSLKHWGVVKTLISGVMKLLSPWFIFCRIYVRKLATDRVESPLPEGVSVRIATHDDLLLGAEQMPDQLSPEFIDAALKRGDFCAAAFEGQQMISFVWRSFSTAPDNDGIWVEFEKPHRYGYKGYTRPEYRGRHLNNLVSVSSDKLCIELGYTHSITFIRIDNHSSNASEHRHKQLTIAGYAGYFKFFARRYPFRSPGAKRKTFRFYHRSTKP